MNIYVDSGKVRLDKRHYIGQGGEGAVYARGSTAYKIYADPRKMIPVGKISELSTIRDKRIIRPLKIISDKRGNPIGYTMTYVDAAYTLCQLFPRAFRDREGLDIKGVTHLVREMQEGVSNVHSAGVLVVDLNEMNFLVSQSFGDIYFIDADSYMTKGFPATALMESVRDRHMQNFRAFSKLTDWFAFGIVSFQMFCGIHPYKGKFKGLKGLDERMKANVSIFHSGVRVPKAAYPVDVIPERYRDWYRAVFEDGKRVAPPTEMGAIVMIVPDLRIIKGTKVLDIAEVFSHPEPIRNFWGHQQSFVVASDTATVLDGHSVPGIWKEPVAVAYSPLRKKAVAVCQLDGKKLRLYNLTDRKEVPFTFEPEEIMSHDGRVYMKSHGNVYELSLIDAGPQVVASSKLACTVMEKATKLFPGVVIQNLLGSIHISVFPEYGMTYQVMLQELDEYKIVDAKYDRGVLMVIGAAKKGRYDRLVFRFSADHQIYDGWHTENITPSGLNFVVLDSGVVVCLNEEEKLEVFLKDKSSAKVKKIEDPVLGGDLTLVRKEGKLGFYRGNALYSMSLKSS